jgi:hypothetical protein
MSKSKSLQELKEEGAVKYVQYKESFPASMNSVSECFFVFMYIDFYTDGTKDERKSWEGFMQETLTKIA